MISRPASRGAFFCFLHIKSHHEKTVVANLILPLILHAFCNDLFSYSMGLMIFLGHFEAHLPHPMHFS